MTDTESKSRELYPLSRKKIIKKTITGSLGWLFLFVLITTGLFMVMVIPNGHMNQTAIGGLILLGILFIFSVIVTYLYQVWYFNVYFYDLTQDYIVIRKDPITPHEITIPYERVQDVYVDQDIFDRLLNIYDVHLSSATVTSGMEAHIDGVEKVSADGLRNVLLTMMKQKMARPPQNTQTQVVQPSV